VMRSKSQNPPGNPKIQHPFLIEMKMDGQWTIKSFLSGHMCQSEP
jgi:hypothetical protein